NGDVLETGASLRSGVDLHAHRPDDHRPVERKSRRNLVGYGDPALIVRRGNGRNHLRTSAVVRCGASDRFLSYWTKRGRVLVVVRVKSRGCGHDLVAAGAWFPWASWASWAAFSAHGALR